MLLLNTGNVRKCRNSSELNNFIEKYVAELDSSDESFNTIYWRLFEEWKKTLKNKPARLPQSAGLSLKG
jgi:hypothetical protein